MDTSISWVDGARGRLIVRGARLDDLVGRHTFESATERLWCRPLTDLGAARVAAWHALDRSRSLPDGMDELRRAIAGLVGDDPELLVGAMAVATATWLRARQGRPPVAPDASADHAADVLRMIHGEPAPDTVVAALDAYLVTVMEHGFNASAFAARVVASTRSDNTSAIVAALGALKGPLHGGAPGPVLDMLDAIGTPGEARQWLHAELRAGRRIMGMGHRVYQVRDPRAAVLEAVVRRLGESPRLALARAVEAEAEALLRAHKPDRPLRANVEFYTAVLLEAIGLPREAFTPTFAIGRVVGWLAHVDEQRATGRLIRPAANYVGSMPDDYVADKVSP